MTLVPVELCKPKNQEKLTRSSLENRPKRRCLVILSPAVIFFLLYHLIIM